MHKRSNEKREPLEYYGIRIHTYPLDLTQASLKSSRLGSACFPVGMTSPRFEDNLCMIHWVCYSFLTCAGLGIEVVPDLGYCVCFRT